MPFQPIDYSGKILTKTALVMCLWVPNEMDCPDVAGTSTKDLQGCIDSDGDGWSDEYGSWNTTFSVMGEEPASSWLTYMILGTVMLISSALAMIVRYSRSASSLEKAVIEEDKGGESNA